MALLRRTPHECPTSEERFYLDRGGYREGESEAIDRVNHPSDDACNGRGDRRLRGNLHRREIPGLVGEPGYLGEVYLD
jgi:hypothetical protein